MSPTMPFNYTFLDESFNEMYQSEQRVGKIAIIFSTLAILIACLGLFGLATFIAEQRTKEIGIRKVLGASVQGIVAFVVKRFFETGRHCICDCCTFFHMDDESLA